MSALRGKADIAKCPLRRSGWAAVRLVNPFSSGAVTNMLRQFLIGGRVSLVNFTIHALMMTTVVGVARVAGAKKISHPSLFLIFVMIPTVSVLMITHAVEVIVWSLVYWTVEAAPPAPISLILRSSTTRHWATATSCQRRIGACLAL